MIRTHWTWKSIFSQSPHVFVGVESSLWGSFRKSHHGPHSTDDGHEWQPFQWRQRRPGLSVTRKWELSIAVFEYWRIWRAISFVLGNQIYDSSAFCMMLSCLVVETHGCAKTVAWKPGFLLEIGWFWGKNHLSAPRPKKSQSLCSCTCWPIQPRCSIDYP